jgi:D-alanine-D-alanine ligase
VAGREFSIALVERPHLVALPISEILFLDAIRKPDVENHAWPIVTYDAKWKPGSRDYQATPPNYLAIVEPQLAVRLAELAVRAYRLLACRDYARVDFRVTPTGQPYILEVNPNPDFGQEACLAGSLAAAGRTHAEFTMEPYTMRCDAHNRSSDAVVMLSMTNVQGFLIRHTSMTY